MVLQNPIEVTQPGRRIGILLSRNQRFPEPRINSWTATLSRTTRCLLALPITGNRRAITCEGPSSRNPDFRNTCPESIRGSLDVFMAPECVKLMT